MIKKSSNEKYSIKYSKSDADKHVYINGEYANNSYWTIILENRSDLRVLGDLIDKVRMDILGLDIQPDEVNHEA